MNSSNEEIETKYKIFETGQPLKIKNISYKIRTKTSLKSGKRATSIQKDKKGKIIGYLTPESKTTDIAIIPTIKTAAIFTGKNFKVKPEHIKENLREDVQGSTILFVVDSSGSMGVKQQMIKVKSLIFSLLIDAYQKRDRVGLISFRVNEAKLLLPFTNSVHIAKKKLDKMPTGGKTPLAHGLALAYKVLKQEKTKNPDGNFIMFLVSDGRGNVPYNNKNCLDQAEVFGIYIKKLGIKTIVLDTETDHLAFGYSWELARLMDGKYMKLKDITEDKIREFINL